MSSWSENYGDQSEGKDLMSQFKVAAKAIASGMYAAYHSFTSFIGRTDCNTTNIIKRVYIVNLEEEDLLFSH